MRIEPIAPPDAASISTLGELKGQLRYFSTAEDATMNRCLVAAYSHMDGRAGVLNRALLTQTWRYHRSAFWSGALNIPLPPLRSVTSIVYVDADGAEQTVEPSTYEVDRFSRIGNVRLAYGKSWPANVATRIDAVQIAFEAGYGDPDEVPGDLKNAELLHAAHLFNNREAVVIGAAGAITVPKAYDSLIYKHIVDFSEWAGC